MMTVIGSCHEFVFDGIAGATKTNSEYKRIHSQARMSRTHVCICIVRCRTRSMTFCVTMAKNLILIYIKM